MIESPLLVCMLPARNAAHDLPGWFASVERFCDAVVALDDGSTDETAELLAAHPLVKRLLRNPRRESYAGWNDAANRNRLLDVVAELNPTWLLSLDADERIDEEDGRALREFLQTDALPGVAYGFGSYAMQGDGSWYIDVPVWMYRVFAFEPGQHFPNRKLHFAPIPESINRGAYITTSFRIQHLALESIDRRRARFEKYREVDPHNQFWPDYTDILRVPDRDQWKQWTPRSPNAPALLGLESSLVGPTDGITDRSITIVVLAGSDDAATRRAIESATSQSAPVPVQVLAVGAAPFEIEGAEWVTVPARFRNGQKRNAGLDAAIGDLILFLPCDLELLPGAVEAAVETHQRGFAIVAGAVESADQDARARVLHEATYGEHRADGTEGFAESPGRFSSYRTSLLYEYGPFATDLDDNEEIPLNRTLESERFVTYRQPAFRARRHGPHTPARAALARTGWHRGVAIGRYYTEAFRSRGELFDGDSSFKQLLKRLNSTAGELRCYRQDDLETREPSPPLSLEVGSWLGFLREIAKPEFGKTALLWGRPVLLAVVTLRRCGEANALAVVKLDCYRGTVRVVLLPLNLRTGAGSDRTVATELGLASGAGMSRFNVRAAIGLPLKLDVEEFVDIELDSAELSIAELTSPRQLAGPLGGIRVLAALGRPGAVRSSIERRALVATAMLARNAIRERSIIEVPLDAGSTVDDEAATIVRQFLEEDRPGRILGERDRLKRARWA